MTPAVRAFFDVLIAGFSTHLALVQADFEARIAGLEDRLQKLTPQNSSLPPSSVHPHGKPIPNKPKSQRKRGGQPGHKRHQRSLVPSEQFNVHMDETPTKEANRKAWLWTAVAKNFVVFAVFGTRAATAITALLGMDFKGIIHCDRAKMYYIASNLQWCWAHLIRDIQGMIDSKVPERVELGNSLMDQLRAMFLQWHRYKADEIDWKEFQVNAIPIATRVNQLLYMGSGCHDSKVRNQCKSLYAHSNKLWMFISNQGIEPTNNAAERQLRHAVIYRKLSFGTQSQSGSRFIERIFSVAATCRIQKRNAFEFIVESVQAKLCNREAPKLLTP